MRTLKQRLTSGWSWIRVIYLLLGISVMIQSIMINQWVGVFLGGWFAIMGLFGLACASGACYVQNYDDAKTSKHISITKETDPVKTGYEEIKGA
ncbi:MAG: hypothetical protein IT214_10825 [Chitinophagaceae bacterium]|jgi:hypothetical protein|nr:hypothetical protein [Chitinophagaceae bacterium]OQY93555.1 MAG: hypothetical protein B6D37_10695 [Sphingobacteriales bacterium UTBCD1]